MKTRLITSAVGIAILLLVMAFFDTILFEVVITAICLIALHEIYKALDFEKADYVYYGFAVYTVIVMLNNFKFARVALLPISYIFAVYLTICMILNSKSLNFTKLGGMALFSGIVIICFYSLIYLKGFLPREQYQFDAVYFIFLTLGFAWGGDSAAYFAGRAFGKHKLAPVVSPHKTVEGAIGGLLGSMLLGVVITAIYKTFCGRIVGVPIENLGLTYYIIIIIMAGVASILGIMGDLFASTVKRQCGIKDYGTIFPGHGGILDRFDSVLFIAPFVSMVVTAVFYHFTKTM